MKEENMRGDKQAQPSIISCFHSPFLSP